MKNPTIAFVQKLPSEIEQKMEAGLHEYERVHGVHVDFQPFAFVLKDDKNEVIGVLDAFSSYSCIHIRDLWVDKAHRGKGYGKKLMLELENHCKDKGFHNINTVSCDFQAPGFYEKCGYQVEFVRKNRDNPKLNMTFFVKFFDKK